MKIHKNKIRFILSLFLILNLVGNFTVSAINNNTLELLNDINDTSVFESNTDSSGITDSEITNTNTVLNQIEHPSSLNDLEEIDPSIFESNTDSNGINVFEPNEENINLKMLESSNFENNIDSNIIQGFSTGIILPEGFDVDSNGVVLVNDKNNAKALMNNPYYRDYFNDSIFGIAGNFFLTGFESVNIRAHVNGNVLTKKLINNTNFGAANLKEITYIQDEISGENKIFLGQESSILILGKTFDIKPDANMWFINKNKIDSPQNNGKYNLWKDDTKQFIALDELQKDMGKLNNDLSRLKDTNGLKFVTDQNEKNKYFNGVDVAIVLPITNENYIVYNTDIENLNYNSIGISELQNSTQTFVLNVDLNGRDNIHLPNIKYKVNGKEIVQGHISQARDGNVIVNIIDSTKNNKKFDGKVTIGNTQSHINAFLLAPYADVSIINNTFDGMIIANNIDTGTTEIHRDIPTMPPEPPTPEDPEEKVNIPVQKKWENSNGEEKSLEIKVVLYADGIQIDDIILRSPDWQGEFKDLPKYKNGTNEEIVYTIEEVKIDGYNSNITGNLEDGFVITNTKTEEPVQYTEIEVEKKWIGINGEILENIIDGNGKEIKEIVLEVLNKNTNEKVKEIILNKSNNWKVSIKELPSKDKLGNDINYIIKEISNIPGFKLEKIQGTNLGNKIQFDVINKKEIGKINIPVEKIWKVKDEETIKDKVVEVKLLENGAFNGKILKLTKENNWKGEFKDLPTKDSDGKDITYDIEEISIPGFDKGKGGNQENGFTLINSEKPTTPIEEYKINIPVQKIWKIKDEETIKDKVVEVKLLENGVFNGKILQLTKENNWKGEFKNLPAKDSDGKDITYDIEEISIPGFDKGKGGNQENGFTLINAERPVNPPEEYKINIPVEKTWKDESGNIINADNINKKITIRLYADGKEIDKIELNSKDGWSHVFKNLPKEDKNGNKIKYTIKEDKVSGYDSEIKENGTKFNVINKEKPTTPPDPTKPKTEVSVEKIWKDEDGNTINADNINKTITIRLYADGKEIDEIELNSKDGWSHVFKNLPKEDKNGNTIKYTIKEDSISGYEQSIKENGSYSFTIINKEKPTIPTRPTKPKKPRDPEDPPKPTTPTEPIIPNEPEIIELEKSHPEFVDIPVEKKWIGNLGNIATINLLADGVTINSIDLNNDNNWKYIFKDLPLVNIETYEIINYTVEEIPVSGYTSNIQGDFIDGFIITNTEIIIPEKPNKPITDNPQTYKSGVEKLILQLLVAILLIGLLEFKRRKINK